MEILLNLAEDKSISDSIDESSIENDSNGGSIISNATEDIRDGNHVHPEFNARDARLKIRDFIKQAQRKW